MKHSLYWKMVVITVCILLVAGFAGGCGGENNSQDSEKLTEINVSHQPEFETFLTYSAIQEGLDKEKGVKFNLMFFDSGMPQIEALPAGQWDVGGTGSVPALFANLRYDTYIIAIAVDESNAQAVLARPENPIFNIKGNNPDYPNAYGSAEYLKGKDLFVTTVSSGHYLQSRYLDVMGVAEDEVNIMNLEQAQAMAAFESGKGDFVTLWAPFIYRGLEKGWKPVAFGSDVDAQNYLVLVADKKFADENPELVVKYLDVYFQKIDDLLAQGQNLANDVQAFYKDWAAMDISKESAVKDIEMHPLYDLETQLEMFESGHMEEYFENVCDFFVQQGKFTAEEKEMLKQKKFGVNPEFLKKLAEERGIK